MPETRTDRFPGRHRRVRSSFRLRTPLLLASMVLFGASHAARAADEVLLQPADLAPFSVSYTVGNNYVSAGSATLALTELDAGLWAYTLETEPTGVFKLTGKGNVAEISLIEFESVDGGLSLRPRSYSYRQDKEKRREVDATFDREAGELAYTRRGEHGSYPLDEPILDRLSVTLAVISALRQGLDRSEYTVFDSGRLKTVVFETEGLETLETSLGEIETLRVLRSNADGSTRTTLTWFAPSLGYMPVKIEQYKRDELVARLTLKRLQNSSANIDDPLIEPEAPVPND